MKTAAEELRDSIVQDAIDGVGAVTTDGTSVTAMSLRQRLEALRDAERRDLTGSESFQPFRLTPIRSKGFF